MKIDELTPAAQQGLRQWAKDIEAGELLLFEAAGGAPHWAWIAFLLRASGDRPEWFPHGKWATIQFIEGELLKEAQASLARKAQ